MTSWGAVTWVGLPALIGAVGWIAWEVRRAERVRRERPLPRPWVRTEVATGRPEPDPEVKPAVILHMDRDDGQLLGEAVYKPIEDILRKQAQGLAEDNGAGRFGINYKRRPR